MGSRASISSAHYRSVLIHSSEWPTAPMLTSAMSLGVCIDSHTQTPDGQRRKASSLINEPQRGCEAPLLALFTDKEQQRSSNPQAFRRSVSVYPFIPRTGLSF
jgi:hypothetical protein